MRSMLRRHLPNAFLRSELSDDALGRRLVDVATIVLASVSNGGIDKRLIPKALAFIRRTPIRIEPRKCGPGIGSAASRLRARGTGALLSHRSGLGRELLGLRRRSVHGYQMKLLPRSELIESWLPEFDGTILYVPSANPKRVVVPDFASRLAHPDGSTAFTLSDQNALHPSAKDDGKQLPSKSPISMVLLHS